MKEKIFDLSFPYNDNPNFIKFRVPDDVTIENIIDKLCEFDKKFYLENKNKESIPLHSPETICNNICSENKEWSWTYFEPIQWESRKDDFYDKE